jgi:hypothetical protein
MRLPFWILIALTIIITGYTCLQEEPENEESATTVEESSETQPTTQNTSQTQLYEFAPEVQDTYDNIILDAYKLIKNSGIDFIEYKALIGVESSFNPDAISFTGAMGLLQFTEIAIEDINENPGNLDFYFSDPFDPKQAIFAGLRFLELINERLGKMYFNDIGQEPSQKEYKKLILVTHNAGIGTITDALFLARADESITFDALAFPIKETDGEEDTPIWKAIRANPSSNGVLDSSGNIDTGALEYRYLEITSYVDKIYDLIPSE